MEKKQTLYVNISSSQSLGKWQDFFFILGWLTLIIGVIALIAGISDGDEVTITAGLGVALGSLVMFFNAAILRGLKTVVENAEIERAKTETMYKLTDAKSKRKDEDKSEQNEPTEFHKGQVVILKVCETEMTIDDIIEEDGKIKYYSSKFGNSFYAEDIEEPGTFWMNKANRK